MLLRLALLLSLAGCGAAVHRQDTLTQIGPIAGLLAGVYDGGAVDCAELRSYGGFGLGTFDRLDGEMVLDAGRIYQVKADGSVIRPAAGVKVPFAAVVHFKPTITRRLVRETGLAQLTELIDAALPSKNLFYAVRIEGDFALVRARSVPPQSPPYLPLAAAAAKQTVFELAGKRGVLVGFRTPSYAGGINVPGYHFHFLCERARCGGHVLDLKMTRGSLQIAPYREFRMLLPDADTPFGRADLELDRSDELRRAEH